MIRTTDYRNHQIHTELVGWSKDMFDLWSSIQGPMQPAGVTVIGKRTKVHGGPFSWCWMHFMGELAGRAAIDVILGVEEEGPSMNEW